MECPACAIDVPDANAERCPYCAYEFPQHRPGVPAAAWLMAAILVAPIIYLLFKWLG